MKKILLVLIIPLLMGAGCSLVSNDNNGGCTENELSQGNCLKEIKEEKKDNQTPEEIGCTSGVNCMPVVPLERAKYCSKSYIDWATENCPDFGVVY